MFEIFTSADAWVALLTLTFLEIVLGIDNIIFINNGHFSLSIFYLLTSYIISEIMGF